VQSNPLLQAGYISVIRFDKPLPYKENSFDVIISNQVLEHVEDIAFAASELSRILKPDGVMYHHFPSREFWREAHTGIPFSHKFPRDSAIRYAYTLFLRSIGFGYHKNEWPDNRSWTKHKLWYIDTLCFYRSYREITEIFGSYTYRRREGDYIRYRWGTSLPIRILVKTKLISFLMPPLFRRIAFQAVEMRS
jgi:SAM-dependent methyltransferase